MKNLRKASAIALSVAAAVSLAACSDSGAKNSASSSPATSPSPDAGKATTKAQAPITLDFYLFSPSGGEPNRMKDIMDEFYKQTKDTLNTTINWHWTTPDQIGNQANLKLAAGENVDAFFTADWVSGLPFQQAVSKGLVQNLDKYFNNDQYPGLKKFFSAEYLNNNKSPDAKNEYHTYGVPFTLAYNSADVFYYRKDLAQKYGVGQDGNLKTPEELEKYYDAIVKNEKGMVPFSVNGATNDTVANYLSVIYRPYTDKHNFRDNTVIKPDGMPYVARTWNDPEYIKYLPDAMKSMDPLFYVKKAQEWYAKGYLEKDLLNQKTAEDQFKAGKAASFYRGLEPDVYNAIKAQLEKSVPGAQLGYFLMEPGLRDNKPKQIATSFKAWNFLSIPQNSKNADRVMQFIDWIYSDIKHHDLFQYGIEGKDWVPDGDSKYKLPDGADPTKVYNFPGFELTWNPNIQRYLNTTPDDIIKIQKTMGDTNFFYQDPFAGFSFVSDKVKAEQAKVNDINTAKKPLDDGVIPADQTQTFMDKIQKQLDAAGNGKILDELQAQKTEFLKAHPYKGQ